MATAPTPQQAARGVEVGGTPESLAYLLLRGYTCVVMVWPEHQVRVPLTFGGRGRDRRPTGTARRRDLAEMDIVASPGLFEQAATVYGDLLD